jgi:thiol-disulfide isomerase/thioredoxin
MARSPRMWLAAVVFASGCVFTSATLNASAQETKQEPAKGDTLFSKFESLTADDDKDTKANTSHRKVYKIELSEGKAYRIELSSKAFDSFLRLEDAKGKEVAFNDDYEPNNLNSRIIYVAPKSGEYRIIVTAFQSGKGEATTGAFKLDVKLASDTEAADARLQARLAAFAAAAPAEQKKLVAEVTKEFVKKGENVTLKDAQIAATLAMTLDEGDIKFARSTIESFIKIFDGASDKKLVGLSRFLEGELKKLERIGTEFEIAGKTTDGTDFELKNLKGKVVLVDFWATWCGPCIGEIPNIIEAHKKYSRQGFVVIGVSLDRENADITKFVEARKLPWKSINVEDSKKLAEKYGVNAIPYPVLVGRDGRVVSLRARGPQLERLLERLMTEKQ